MEGADIWDDFLFDIDYFQETQFDVVGSLDIVLYNQSAHRVVPTVICNAELTIKKGSSTFTVTKNTTQDSRFYLDVGKNNLKITGTGHIEFQFRKELL